MEETTSKTLQNLLNTSPNEFLNIRSCGEKSICDTQNEIKFFVSKHLEIFNGEYFVTQDELIEVTIVPLFTEVLL